MVDRGANIDLFFRNGLKDYEVLPPPGVWDNIQPVIGKKQRSLFFLRAAASVGVIVSLASAAYFFSLNLSKELNGPAITLNQDATPGGSYLAKAAPKVIPAAIRTEKVAEKPVIQENKNIDAGNSFSFRMEPIGLFTPIRNDKKIPKRTRTDSSINPELNSQPKNAVAQSIFTLPDEAEAVSEQPKQLNRWSVGAAVSPTYYSHSNLSKNDASGDLVSSEKAVISYTGGFSFSYSVSKRVSLQTGVYYSAMGNKISQIGSFTGFRQYFDAKGGSDFSVLTSRGTIKNTNTDIYLMDQNLNGRVMTTYTLDVFDPVKANLKYLNSTVLQNLNYLELPFVLRYKVLDKKVDFNVIGAISYNILVGNSAYIYADGTKYFLGKTEGLSPVTLTSSIGMGMEYNISERLSLNLEPTFRYYMTPLGGLVGSSIHPYSFGIFSGFSYRF